MTVSSLQGTDYPEIREEVIKLCKQFPGDLLAQARPRDGLSVRVREGARRCRLPRRPDSRGIRGFRPAAIRVGGNPRGDSACRLQRCGLPCTDVHHGRIAAARQRGAKAEIPAGNCERRVAPAGVRRDRAHERYRYRSAEDGRRAPGGADTSSTARRSGRAGPNTPTSCCCWRGPRPGKRCRAASMAFPYSSWT